MPKLGGNQRQEMTENLEEEKSWFQETRGLFTRHGVLGLRPLTTAWTIQRKELLIRITETGITHKGKLTVVRVRRTQVRKEHYVDGTCRDITNNSRL